MSKALEVGCHGQRTMRGQGWVETWGYVLYEREEGNNDEVVRTTAMMGKRERQ